MPDCFPLFKTDVLDLGGEISAIQLRCKVRLLMSCIKVMRLQIKPVDYMFFKSRSEDQQTENQMRFFIFLFIFFLLIIILPGE